MNTWGFSLRTKRRFRSMPLVLRAESFKRVRKLGGGNTTLHDSLTTVPFLRNNVAQ